MTLAYVHHFKAWETCPAEFLTKALSASKPRNFCSILGLGRKIWNFMQRVMNRNYFWPSFVPFKENLERRNFGHLSIIHHHLACSILQYLLFPKVIHRSLSIQFPKYNWEENNGNNFKINGMRGCGIYSNGPGRGPVTGFCKFNNKFPGFIKSGETFHHLSNNSQVRLCSMELVN